jgi:Putative adhesin
MRKRTILILAASCLAFGADVSNTERLDFPSGGTLRFVNSNGELTVEGWDQPGIEITTIKSADVRITAERKGDEIVITSVFPKHGWLARPFRGLSDSHIEYRVKAPRNARVTIEHTIGEIHISGMAGDIRATDQMGQITVLLPQEGQYAIDAKSKLGAVDSDFPGDELRKHKFGHSFLHEAQPSSQKLYLRIGFGDITILEVRRPVQQR